MTGSRVFGFIIERSGFSWDERFWYDLPIVKQRGFASDDRATIFASLCEAEKALEIIEEEYGHYCYVTALSDLYPPAI